MPGVQVRASFTGASTVTATYTIVQNEAYNAFVVECDGVPQYPKSTEEDGYSTFNSSTWVAGEEVTVPLCTGLDPTTSHEVKIFKSTEPQWNGLVVSPNFVTLLSIDGDHEFALTTPSALPSRKIGQQIRGHHEHIMC